MKHWSSDYIGKPYSKDYDCAHLLIDVQNNVFNRDLYVPVERARHIVEMSDQIADNKANYITQITEDESTDGDVVLMVCLGRLNHIGVLCVIKGIRYVLHNVKSTGNVTLHKIRELDKYSLVVEGYYRCIENETK